MLSGKLFQFDFQLGLLVSRVAATSKQQESQQAGLEAMKAISEIEVSAS